MTINNLDLNWITLDGWYRNNLFGFADTRGLLRAMLNGKTMFIGRAAAQGSNLKLRLDAYRKKYGTGHNHYAGKMIYSHRADIEMQIAVLALPSFEINQLADALIDRLQPPWNMPTDGFRQ